MICHILRTAVIRILYVDQVMVHYYTYNREVCKHTCVIHVTYLFESIDAAAAVAVAISLVAAAAGTRDVHGLRLHGGDARVVSPQQSHRFRAVIDGLQGDREEPLFLWELVLVLVLLAQK